MCGIAGEIGSPKHILLHHKNIQAMTNSLCHRGPDEEGYYQNFEEYYVINLGVRRLAIIDKEHGQQPVKSERYIVIQNGEIYNHKDLRAYHESRGLQFETHCDTEVIAKHLSRVGISGVGDFHGMFAIAAYDTIKNKLHLIRDRLGQKPLYYYYDAEKRFLIFASEIKALLTHPSIPKKINAEGIYRYLCLQYVPEPETAFLGIKTVPPGHVLTYDPKGNTLSIDPYWQLEPGAHEFAGGPETTLQDIRATLRNAVHDRLESEVPIGVYLSGGIDSAIVTSLAKEVTKELHTFTVDFEETAYSEGAAARQTSERFGTVHHETIVSIPSLPDLVERITNQYDQPYGDCSAIPTMLLAQASKKYITVALTGDGGDEAFGGYDRYLINVANIMDYLPMLTVWRFEQIDSMLRQAFLAQLKCDHAKVYMLKQATTGVGLDLQNQKMWLDTKLYLLNDIIVKMDRATMAHSVEARCPFLDHRVFELAFSLSGDEKIAGLGGKSILKRAFGEDLGMDIIGRKKRGFSVPINEWFRQEKGRELLASMVSDPCWPWGIFEHTTVGQMIERHLCKAMNVGHGLWILLMLHKWLKKHFE